MSLEPGLIGYAALASFTLVQRKYQPTPPVRFMPSPFAAKRIGIALLLLSVAIAFLNSGIAVGSVIWIGQLSVAGAILVLMMSWRRRLALLLGVGSLFTGLALSIIS